MLLALLGGAAPAAPQELPASSPVNGVDQQPQGLGTAIVLEVTGRVRTRDAKGAPWKPLKENDVLRAGAEIQTGIRSTVALRIGENATALVDPGTTVVIPSIDRAEGLLSTQMGVRMGRVDVRVDHVGFENDFSIVTPSTVVAVRGTALAVSCGSLSGTEVMGARLNVLRAIEARWIERRLNFYFGHGASTRRFPDPASGAIDATVDRHLMPGVVDSPEQLEQAWFTGSLQNVVFNINNLQRSLNQQSPLLDEALAFVPANDELAIAASLQRLIEIRAATGNEADVAVNASALAQLFAQKAVTLAAAAEAMLPDFAKTVDAQNAIAAVAAAEALDARDLAVAAGNDAAAAKVDAYAALDATIIAVKEQDFRLAQYYANEASQAAALALVAATSSIQSAGDAFSAAQVAAAAAATAQGAINQYFAKVAEIDGNASAASAQATIAANAAQTASALNELAKQIGAGIDRPAAAALVAQIGANTSRALEASIAAAMARDSALEAASNARSMGERTLFNHAAVYASQAATAAAEAGLAGANALQDAADAQKAADLAQLLAEGCLWCK